MQPKQLVTFVAGVVSAVAFLTYCGTASTPGSANPGTGDGGSPSNGDSGSDRSGSRLKLYRYTTADGLRLALPDEFFDAQLGVKCHSARVADGSTRCIPLQGGYSGYSDAQCTQEVFYLLEANSRTPPPFVAAMDYLCGSNCYKAFRTGAALPGGSALYRKNSAGDCTDITAQNTSALIFETGEVAPPETFVKFEYGHD